MTTVFVSRFDFGIYLLDSENRAYLWTILINVKKIMFFVRKRNVSFFEKHMFDMKTQYNNHFWGSYIFMIRKIGYLKIVS